MSVRIHLPLGEFNYTRMKIKVKLYVCVCVCVCVCVYFPFIRMLCVCVCSNEYVLLFKAPPPLPQKKLFIFSVVIDVLGRLTCSFIVLFIYSVIE